MSQYLANLTTYLLLCAHTFTAAADRPNIIYILCDDLGYGDVKCLDDDPERYPQFNGSVISVDTRPFFRPPAKSPGGRPQYYYGNAETFLEIGEALARAVIGTAVK